MGFKHFIPGTIWFIVVLVLITMPSQDLPDPGGWGEWLKKIQFDKMVHAGMFGILSFLFMLPFRKTYKTQEQKRFIFFIIATSTIFWGFATECIQIALPPRTFDWLDWAADSAGVGIMWLLTRNFLFQYPKTAKQQ
jgi:hypothetical protein